MDFAGLKQAAASATIKPDAPDYVYEVGLAEMESTVRIAGMQKTATLTVDAETVPLPSDFLDVISQGRDDGSAGLIIIDVAALDAFPKRTGKPVYGAIVDGGIRLYPEPNGQYDIEFRYYAKNAPLVNGTDRNAILRAYPNLYLFQICKQIALWCGDVDLLQWYSGAYADAYRAMEVAERRKRRPGGINPVNARNLQSRRRVAQYVIR